MPTTVYGAASAPLPGGDVLVAGGEADSGVTDAAQLYDPTTRQFTALSATLQTARLYPVAAPLPDGDVLIAGGSGTDSLNTAELFDPSSETFTTIGSAMPYGFYAGVAAPLPNGDVLIAGGSSDGSTLDQAMIYDPTSQSFTELAGTMTTPRSHAFAAPLPGGEILIGGGSNGTSELSSAELYDPSTETFSALPATTTVPRFGSVAVELPDGNVLIAGGDDGTPAGANDTSELFTPATDTFTQLGATLPANTVYATATALSNGQVLVAGGESEFGTIDDGVLFLAQPEAVLRIADFGDEGLGQISAAQTLTVTNVGYQSLAISGATILGTAFAIKQDECVGVTLAYQRSCTMLVTFIPAGAGPQSATLTLTDNEIVPASVTLTGDGIGPTVAAPNIGASARTAFALRLIRHSTSRRRVTLRYKLTAAAEVTLRATSSRGRTFVLARRRVGRGEHTISWNGRLRGKLARVGRYQLKLTAVAGGVTISRSATIHL